MYKKITKKGCYLCFFAIFAFSLQPNLTKMQFKLQLRDGKEWCYEGAQVMGIINITPDSFFAASRMQEEGALRARIGQMIAQGATLFDVGACSTRPGGEEATEADELARLRWALPIVVSELQGRFPISVDTFRAKVAHVAVAELGAHIINDVYGGLREPGILHEAVSLGVPYILTAPVADVAAFFAERLPLLEGTQVILDPGFGFGKTVEQNYQTMRELPALIKQFADCPMLVGISRKSMIKRLLGTTPEEALNGTTVLNTVALQAGAHILRVHDVQPAVEAVKITAAVNRQ